MILSLGSKQEFAVFPSTKFQLLKLFGRVGIFSTGSPSRDSLFGNCHPCSSSYIHCFLHCFGRVRRLTISAPGPSYWARSVHTTVLLIEPATQVADHLHEDSQFLDVGIGIGRSVTAHDIVGQLQRSHAGYLLISSRRE